MLDFDESDPQAGYPDEHARRGLACASPGCNYLVNSRWEMGGYCCIACSEGGAHGPRCECVVAPARAPKADPAWYPMQGDQLEEKELRDAIQQSLQEVGSDSAASGSGRRVGTSGDQQEERELRDAIQRSMEDAGSGSAALGPGRRLGTAAEQVTRRVSFQPQAATRATLQPRLYGMQPQSGRHPSRPMERQQVHAEPHVDDLPRGPSEMSEAERGRMIEEEKLLKAKIEEQAKRKMEEAQRVFRTAEENSAVGIDLGGKVLPKNATKIINGGYYEALSVLIMRTEEDMSSPILVNIPPESVVQVLEAGNGRRIKVRGADGQAGWVSVCKADGKQLLLPKLATPEPPLPGGFKRGQTIYWIRFSVRQDYDKNYGSEGFCHGQAEDKRLQDQCVHAEFAWGKGDFFVKNLSVEPPVSMPGNEDAPTSAAFPAAPASKPLKPPECVPAAPPQEESSNDKAPMLHEVHEKAQEVAESVQQNVLPKIKQAEKLGMLTLRECNLCALPSAATAPSLKKLRMADLSMNSLRALPETLGTWESIKTLNCSQNNLESLPQGIGRMSKLQKLELSQNLLSRLPAAIAELSSLKELNLSSNCFGPSLPDVFGGPVAKALEELNLSDNSLEELPPSLFGLQKLGRLLLQDNRMQRLPEGLARLERVHYMNAASNKLTYIPTAVLEMPALSELWLEGNPIDRQALQENPALEGLLRRREARINNIIISKVGPVIIDLRVCGLSS